MPASQVAFYKMLMLITAGSGVSFGVLFISRNNASFLFLLFPPSFLSVGWERKSWRAKLARVRFLPLLTSFIQTVTFRRCLKVCHVVSAAVQNLFQRKKISRTFHHTTGNYHFLKIKPPAIQKASALYLYISEVKRRIDVILFLSCCSTLSLAAPALGSISNPFCGPCADFRCDLM